MKSRFCLRFKALFIAFVATLFFDTHSYADTSRLRIVGAAGFGQAVAVAKDNESSVESPLGFSASIDYMVDSRYDVGAEHMRSLSGNGTTVGLTGLTLKHYFRFQHPKILEDSLKHLNNPVIQIKAWSPYIGGSMGFAQASILDTKVNAVGIYLNIKGGLDYPISTTWGMRCEGNLALTAAGTGRIQMVNALLGFYTFL